MRISVRVFGDLSLLPVDLQQILARVMDITKNNDK